MVGAMVDGQAALCDREGVVGFISCHWWLTMMVKRGMEGDINKEKVL